MPELSDLIEEDSATPATRLITLEDLVVVDGNGMISDGDWIESKDQDPNGDVRLIQLADIGDGIFKNVSNRWLTSARADELNCTFLEAGDLLVARMPDPIGRCAIYPGFDYPAITAVDVCILRLRSSSLCREWLLQALNAPDTRWRINELAGGGTRQRVSTSELRQLKLLTPEIDKQSKIAEILQTWDEAIQCANRLVESYENQYLGLRCKLIDWSSGNRAALRTFLSPVVRPTPRPDSPYRALSIRSHGKGTYERIVEKPDDVDMDTLYVARAGDIIVNITFAWEGAVALVPQEHDGGLVSHRFPTFVPITGKGDARFLRHILRMRRFTYLLGTVSPGGAGRNRVLSKRDFLDLEIPLPTTEEQARIAAILDDAENAIAAEMKLRNAFIRQKRSLMQKLLTGEWQVKVESKRGR